VDFSKKIIDWYFQHKRNLPWRKTKDAFKIWVSEVILQQTRVEQGLTYYKAFVKKFPDVYSLAAANENDVLKLWQGLGYYTRARNMMAGARQIVEQYNGIVPNTFEQIIKIKGIGSYSASAILSFAFNKPYPVMDGNVKRVLARYFNIGTDIKSKATENLIFRKLERLFDKKNPADFNQAIMEFGALQCKINNPECTQCVLKSSCKAFIKNRVSKIPYTLKKTELKTRFFYYLVPLFKFKNEKFTYLEKRQDDDIWRHLYQFPLIESEKKLNIKDLIKSTAYKKLMNDNQAEIVPSMSTYLHKLSHQIIEAAFLQVNISKELPDENYIKVKLVDLKKYPVSRLTEKYLNQNLNLKTNFKKIF